MKTGSALFIGAEPVFYLKVSVCNGGLIMFHHKKINIAITFHWGGLIIASGLMVQDKTCSF